MTSKKRRRGRQQESLPLEPSPAVSPIADVDVAPTGAEASATGEPTRRRRSRRSTAAAAPLPMAALPEVAEAPAHRPDDLGAGQDPEGLHVDIDAAGPVVATGTTALVADAEAEPLGSAVSPEGMTEVVAAVAAAHEPSPPVEPTSPIEPTTAEAGVTRLAGDAPEGTASVGARLRAAREARGLSREALAAAARIPLSAIGHIESGNIAALGAPIYARGFLRSYARAVEVPEIVVEAALRDVQAEEPVLIVANPASVGDRFAARYKNPLVYALLTLVVVVPLVFLATPQGQRQPEPAFAPLDAEPVEGNRAVVGVDGGVEGNGVAESTQPRPTPPPALPPAPVMASMAPISSPIAAPRPSGGRILTLRVSEPSWVELTAADGRRLEWAQLPAGTTREYVVDGGADLVVGNAPGVSATLNGRTVDLNAVANRNVARLRVGDAAPAAGQ